MTTSVAIDPFIAELRELVAQKHANLTHPFVQELLAGRLSREDLKIWAAQRYKGITGMGIQHIGNLFTKAPDDRVRKHIWETLGEEGGYEPGTSSHRDWLFDFGEALGMTRQEFENTRPLPETIAVKSHFLLKFYTGTFAEGFASMVCIESQNPSGFPAWAKALEGHYGVPREALAWFIGHIEADSEESGHAGEGWEIILEQARTEEQRKVVRQAVQDSLDIYWLSLDGILRATSRGR